MAAVFPESMDRLDVSDTKGSLSKIENHIRYMQERVEFSMRNVTRNVSEAGVSSTELYILLTALQNDLAALTSIVQGMAGDLTAAKGDVANLSAELDSTNTAVSGLSQSVSMLQQSIDSLGERVSALEDQQSIGSEGDEGNG